ncbi:MAG: methyltransferase [Parasporobacterium sp.]|nr:methyltransferase [Parasporobacterium sp.]
MYRKIPFVKKELDVIDTRPGFMGATVEIKDTPVTARQNMEALFFDKHPYWMPVRDAVYLLPPIYNDNLGRGAGKDIVDTFGIKWTYEPVAGGSIVKGGNPILKDVNEWRDVIKLPDIDSWDWETAAAENKIDSRLSCQMTFINGFWFERLISFMDFMPAAMALIDEDQTDAIKDLFEATTDLGCRLVDKFCEYWPMLDGFNIHDDWGSQKAPFFSMDTAYELFVPFMKKITDHIHSKGRYVTLHSCGHNKDRVQCYIDGGFDEWTPQSMNDVEYLYDNFGDKICIGVFPDREDIPNLPEEEQRKCAREFAERFCQPGKFANLGVEGIRRVTPAFLDELYEATRKIYLNR